jgi:hypothetical protein
MLEHNQELFPFLDDPLIEPTNSRAERQWWPMVIMRKLTFENRSGLGASNQAVTISIIETGVLNDVEPLDIFLALSAKPLTLPVQLPGARPP